MQNYYRGKSWSATYEMRLVRKCKQTNICTCMNGSESNNFRLNELWDVFFFFTQKFRSSHIFPQFRFNCFSLFSSTWFLPIFQSNFSATRLLSVFMCIVHSACTFPRETAQVISPFPTFRVFLLFSYPGTSVARPKRATNIKSKWCNRSGSSFWEIGNDSVGKAVSYLHHLNRWWGWPPRHWRRQ